MLLKGQEGPREATYKLLLCGYADGQGASVVWGIVSDWYSTKDIYFLLPELKVEFTKEFVVPILENLLEVC